MKCKSCKEEVPQKFIHAISINTCPLCGLEIMDNKLKVIFSNLKDIMVQAEEFPEEIADWFKSNYNLSKQDNNLHPEAQDFSDVDSATVVESKKSSSPQTTTFIKRSGVDINRIKKAVEDIKGAAKPEEFNEGFDEDLDEGVTDSDIDGISSEDDMADLFADNLNGSKDILDMDNRVEKLKKLRGHDIMSGSLAGGSFRRSS